MKISSISNYSYVKNNQSKSFSPLKHNHQLQKDTISFTSKSLITNAFGENIKQATNLGRQIYNKLSRGVDRNELAKLINQEFPNVSVKAIEELDIEDKALYFAFYTHKINSDFTPKFSELFIDFKNSNNPTLNMIGACETAHEYTHLIQSYSLKEIEEYRALAQNDKEYLEVIAGFGDSIFKYFDTVEQVNMARGAFSTQDAMSAQIYGKLVPRKNDVTKNLLIAKSPYANEKEFRANVNKVFNDYFNLASKQLLTLPDNQVLPRLKEKYRQVLASNGLDKLRQDVKKYLEISAKKEKEAYAVESQVAKTILKTTDSLNIDSFPLYYQMLENAFKLG